MTYFCDLVSLRNKRETSLFSTFFTGNFHPPSLSLSSDTNTKMFKSEENGKNVVTSVLQSIGIKPSMMSGDSKAKQDARYFHICYKSNITSITCKYFSYTLFSKDCER